VARALFATGHAHAEELNALRGQVTGTQVCIFEVGVASVDDEIALFEVRQQVGDHGIHGGAGGHEHNYCAGLAQQMSELLHVFRAINVPFFGFLAQGLDFGRVFVITRHRITVVGHVQHEIAPHDAQPDHARLRTVVVLAC